MEYKESYDLWSIGKEMAGANDVVMGIYLLD